MCPKPQFQTLCPGRDHCADAAGHCAPSWSVCAWRRALSTSSSVKAAAADRALRMMTWFSPPSTRSGHTSHVLCRLSRGCAEPAFLDSAWCCCARCAAHGALFEDHNASHGALSIVLCRHTFPALGSCSGSGRSPALHGIVPWHGALCSLRCQIQYLRYWASTWRHGCIDILDPPACPAQRSAVTVGAVQYCTLGACPLHSRLVRA